MILTTALAAQAHIPTVCIDPGHPSEVGRGTSGRKVSEIRVAWRIAHALESLLVKDGFRVVLTKHGEEEAVLNRRRAEIANQAHADLMIRLHCDAGSGSGFAVYYPSQTGVSAGVRGPSPEVMRSSAEAAWRVHAAMAGRLKGELPDEGLKTDRQTAVGARQGALTGSIFSRVPVVLVEMAVLGNRHDEDWITTDSGERKMAQALEAGVLAAIRSG